MTRKRVIHYREDMSKVWTECECGWVGTKYFKKYGRGRALENAGKNWSNHTCFTIQNDMSNPNGESWQQ